MSRSISEGRALSAPRAACAGFTLIEALVALAVVASCLTAIASLTAANLRVVAKSDQRAGLVAALRSVETGLPDRIDLKPGRILGEKLGQEWSVEIRPFEEAAAANPRAAALWTPEAIALTARSPSGAILTIDTIRLQRRSEQ